MDVVGVWMGMDGKENFILEKMLFWKDKAGGHGARRNFGGSDPWAVYSSFLIGWLFSSFATDN
jgi:hypothetical protein